MNISIKFTRILIRPSPFIRLYSKLINSNLIKLLEKMPKEPKHIAEAQKQRLKIKERQQKYVPGKVILQVLGTGAEGAPKALYMFTDNAKYLFNCGEGTQRLAHEHKMKLSKLEHIFITESCWGNIGGLPGVSLTIQDVGVPQITLHGPEGLDELFIATRRFVVLRDLKIKMADCNVTNKFVDNVMSVSYVPIRREIKKIQSNIMCNSKYESDCCTTRDIQPTHITNEACTSTRSKRSRSKSRSRSRSRSGLRTQEDDTDYYAHERKRNRRRGSRSRSRSWNQSEGNYDKMAPLPPNLNSYREQQLVMCYICRLHPRPGALNIEACAKKKVPPGPLLGQLKDGKDVTLPDGTVVYSKDVCFPDDPGPVMLVVDCPTEEYLNSFLKEEAFKDYQLTAKQDDDLAFLVVHFTPAHIFKNSRYQSWLERFSPSTQHLVLNETNTCMGSEAVHRIQYQLNLVSNKIFPLLKDKGTPTSTETHTAKKQKIDSEIINNDTEKMLNSLSVNLRSVSPNSQFLQPGTLCKFHLRPKKGLDRESELLLTPEQYVQETLATEGFKNIYEKTKIAVEKHRQTIKAIDYPRILFLGTGSCIPNKTRNVSGILLQVSKNCNILMDCGEGTYGQLVRFFGHDKYKQVLNDLKAVYISHLHADHHLGLVGLLLGRRRALESQGIQPEPLVLFAPHQILSWLTFYHRRFQSINGDYEIIPNSSLVNDDKKYTEELCKYMKSMEMNYVQTCLVRHCPNAFGVRFNHKNNWSLTYSGDTMPCENLIELGKNTDLLIHEATMEDDLEKEAVYKMHSTTSQAIDSGKEMCAQNIILTHFSQRYAKLPRFSENLNSGNICIAFDNMNISLSELSVLPILYPAMKNMFAEHHDELEHKAVKRQLKAEREKVIKVTQF